MNNFSKRIDLLTNIAIIVASIVLCGALVKRYFISGHTSNVSTTPEISAGAAVPLPEVDWAKNKRTVLLALSTSCHFCTESAPFYQQLARERQSDGVRLIAAFPESVQNGQKYLNDLDVQVDEVRQISLKQLGVIGTPTVVVINRDGVVVAVWRGKLPPNKEAEILSQLRGAQSASGME